MLHDQAFLGKLVHDFTGNLAHTLLRVKLFKNNDKLVATETGDRVALAQGVFKPMGRFQQNHVTNIVPQGVIDIFKPIQIDENQGQGALGSLGALDGLLETVVEQEAVRQAGQRIVMGQVIQPVTVHSQLAVPLFDLFKHFIETIGQPSQFVTPRVLNPQGKGLLLRDSLHCPDQPFNRFGDYIPEFTAEQIRSQPGQEDGQSPGHRELNHPFFHIDQAGLNDQGPQPFPLVHDGLVQAHMVKVELVVVFGSRIKPEMFMITGI